MSVIAGQSVVITGAARGIGRALAAAMADAGADVIGVDLTAAAMADTAAEVQEAGRVFRGYACDVSDGPAVQALAARLRADGRAVDVLIANAGVLSSGQFVEAPMAHWQRLIEVNLLGTMHCCHALLPLLAASGGGRILAMASVAGKVGTPGMAAYAASKHGVVGFCEALRSELQLTQTPVGVQWVCPAMVRTQMTHGVDRSALVPLVTPETVAEAVLSALRTGRAETFVPRWTTLLFRILPGLFPNLTRRLSRSDRTTQGWIDARKRYPAHP